MLKRSIFRAKFFSFFRSGTIDKSEVESIVMIPNIGLEKSSAMLSSSNSLGKDGY
ncbi:MAG: hypothetical protein IPN13_12295 [Bacteroidetes bacterium]|nr:hypothetical protein [Bacteroidota bacterium]